MKAQNTKPVGAIAEGSGREKQIDKFAAAAADRNGTGAGYALKKGIAKAAAPDSGVRVARDMTDQLLSKQYENTKGAAAPQRKRPSRG